MARDRSTRGRSTRRWRTIKRELRERAEAEGLPCWICTEPIDYTIVDIFDDEVFEADHVLSRKTHPHLAEDPSNAAPSHRRCNNAKGEDVHEAAA
jgi:5-methylcytosine-specific restriction endonuclease McrA